MPVITARELDQAIASGDPAGQPDNRHRRLGTRRHKPYRLDGRHGIDELGRKLDLLFGWRTERRASRGRKLNCLDDLDVSVTEDQRAPRQHPIDVAIPVDILDHGALALLEEQRVIEPDSSHRSNWRVDAAGDERARSSEQLGAPCLVQRL